MKKVIKGVVFSVLIYVVALAVTVPARLALAYVPNMPPALRLSGVDGSIWKGNAGNVRINNFDLGRTGWTFNPLELLTAKIGGNVTVQRDGLQGEGVVSANRSEIHLQNTTLQADAKSLAPLLRIPVSVGGVLDVRLASLIASRERLQSADGTITWRDAQIVAASNVSLGDIVLQLQPNGENVDGVLSSKGGVVGVSGKITLQPGWRYQLNLQLKPSADASADVIQVLKFVGRANAQGVVNVRQQGQLKI